MMKMREVKPCSDTINDEASLRISFKNGNKEAFARLYTDYIDCYQMMASGLALTVKWYRMVYTICSQTFGVTGLISVTLTTFPDTC